MKKSKRRPSKRKPVWERGYLSHGYWLGNERLGVVRTGARGEWDGKYRWQAGNHAGQAPSLAEAKRAVEGTVLIGASQLQLFND